MGTVGSDRLLLADLMTQIRSATVSFDGLDRTARTKWFRQGIPGWDDDDA